MFRLSKKADYGLIAVKHLSDSSGGRACSAKDIAEAYGIPPELLAKILQKLVKTGLLVSQHGTNGGYALARSAQSISALEVILAIDGPLFITACVTDRGQCGQSLRCNVREPLRKVNDSIREVLSSIKIADMGDGTSDSPEEFAAEPPAIELVRLGR